METLFAAPERQYNNSEQETGVLLLSDWVDVATVGDIRIRFDIVSVDAGGAVHFSLSWGNGGIEKAAYSEVYTAPGEYEIAINRSDRDNATTFAGMLAVVGRARLSFGVYSVAEGEDVL